MNTNKYAAYTLKQIQSLQALSSYSTLMDQSSPNSDFNNVTIHDEMSGTFSQGCGIVR